MQNVLKRKNVYFDEKNYEICISKNNIKKPNIFQKSAKKTYGRGGGVSERSLIDKIDKIRLHIII